MKIAVFAMDSAGHIYPCVGLAQALAKRGHAVHLLLNEAFVEEFSRFGFPIVALKRTSLETETEENSPPSDDDDDDKTAKSKRTLNDPIKDMAELLLSSGFISPGTALERLQRMDDPTAWLGRLYSAHADYQPQLAEYFRSERPDLAIVDSFLLPPALHQAALPYVFVNSGSPLELYDSSRDRLPPSGFPTDSDPASWEEFSALNAAKWAPAFRYQTDLNAAFGYDDRKEDKKAAKTRRLDIYGYPVELDYVDVAGRSLECCNTMLRVDAFSYEEDPSKKGTVFELPEDFQVEPEDRLVYLSLGSMCSVDVELMKRITGVLAKVEKLKVIVSKGPRADEYELPANAWGERFLPQTAILPLVDLVITHGGNNTLTETFTYGKPLIAMGFFGDQAGNAQRVMEKGFRVRLEPYSFTEEQLIEAVERLLNDDEVKQRAKAAAERIAKDRSKDKAAEAIERFVEKVQRKVKN